MDNKVVEEPEWSTDPFPLAAGRLIGGPDWKPGTPLVIKPVLQRVRNWPYTPEYLRAMIAGDKRVTLQAIELLAPALGVSPSYFLDYRLLKLCEAARESPKLVDALYNVMLELRRHASGDEWAEKGN